MNFVGILGEKVKKQLKIIAIVPSKRHSAEFFVRIFYKTVKQNASPPPGENREPCLSILFNKLQMHLAINRIF